MANPTSYEVPDEELVTRLMQAAADAGAARSGLVIDVTAGYKVRYMHYLKGYMLARVDGVKPTLQPKTKVVVFGVSLIQGQDLRGYSFGTPALAPGPTYTIDKVWYANKRWFLEFSDIHGTEGQPALFPAEKFEVVEESTPTP